ncbi:MAG: hypothetical protein MZW92_61245 [Comamonadaceae bacterium]|nr:hypothetical protein [Comamonadaceae bacterium]
MRKSYLGDEFRLYEDNDGARPIDVPETEARPAAGAEAHPGPRPPAGHQAPAADQPRAHRGHRRGALPEPDDRDRGRGPRGRAQGQRDRGRRRGRGPRTGTGVLDGLNLESTESKINGGRPRSPTSWPASRNTSTRASGPTSARTARRSPWRTPCPGRPRSGTTSNWQASLTFFDPEERELATNIIGDINESGYLESGVEELARPEPDDAREDRGRPGQDQDLRPRRLRQPGPAGGPASPRWTTSRSRTRRPGPSSPRTGPLLEKSDYAQLARVAERPALGEVRSRIDIIQGLDFGPRPEVQRGEDVLRRPGHRRQPSEGDEWKVARQRRGPAPAPASAPTTASSWPRPPTASPRPTASSTTA